MSEGTSGAAGSARKRWDVALSYASSNRPYVQRVAAALKEKGIRCFFDVDEQVGLWGKYLTEELPRIYSEQAAAVVIFSSADYAAKSWTSLERRSALNRAVRERREYVLPARFDEAPLPGILSDLIAIDLRYYEPERFADLVVDKLSALGVHADGSEESPSAPGRFNLFCDVHSDPVEMIQIPTGRANVLIPEQPLHTFSIDSFAISRYPITIGSFSSFMQDDGGFRDDRWWADMSDDHRFWTEHDSGRLVHEPWVQVANSSAPAAVTRGAAVAYCRWFSIRNQMRLVLPTLAHWIRAARGDSRQRYPWGEYFDRSRCNCGTREVELQPVYAHPQGSSCFGIEDLVGNCPEWVNIFLDGIIEWEKTGTLHNWGTWSDSKDHLSYACDYPGNWVAPFPSVRAGFRICTISATKAVESSSSPQGTR